MSSTESVTPLNAQDRVTIVSPHNGQTFFVGQRASVEAWIEGPGINRADLLVIGGGISQQETQSFSPLQSGMVNDVNFMTQPFNTTGNVFIRVASVHPDFPMGTRATEVVNIQVQVRGYNDMNRQELAQEILNRYHGTSATGRRICMRWWADNMTDANRRSAFANIQDTANGLMATTRPNNYTGVNQVHLSEDLLRAILFVSDEWNNVQINAIAGGEHFGQHNIEEHIRGMAVDFQANDSGVVQINTGAMREDVLDHLEKLGFRTQRTRGPNDVGVAGPNYIGPTNRVLHVSIFGRNS